MQFVMDSIAPPPARETPQAALVRRGAHLVEAPDGHSLRRAVPHLFSDFHRRAVMPFNVVEGLLARVLRLPAAAPAPALARVGGGAVDLGELEATLAIYSRGGALLSHNRPGGVRNVFAPREGIAIFRARPRGRAIRGDRPTRSSGELLEWASRAEVGRLQWQML